MGKDIMSLMSVPVFIMARPARRIWCLTLLGAVLLPNPSRPAAAAQTAHVCWSQEPFTVLQKMSEIMEYSELLDKAAACEVSPFLRPRSR